jgi:O-antigen ligase
VFKVILELLLGAAIFANIFSLTRLYGIQQELYVGKYVSIMLLGILLFFAFICKKKTLGIKSSIKCISLTFALWIFFMLISIFDAPSPLSGILVIVSYSLLFLLSFFLLPSHLNKEYYIRYNKIFWGSLLVALVISVILGFKDPASAYIFEDRFRYQAFFSNPNSLGMFSLLGILASLQVYAQNRQRRFIIAVLPVLFLLYLSNSRASILAAGVAILMIAFLFLLGRSNPRTKMLLGASTFAALGSLIFLGFLVVSLVPEDTINKLTSSRLLIWSQALGSLEDIQLFFGQGIGKEGLGSLTFDNYYINIFVQTGLFGLSAFVAFIMSVLHGLWRQLKQTPDDNSLRISIAFLVALIVYSLFENALFSFGNILSLYIWMNIGYQVTKD